MFLEIFKQLKTAVLLLLFFSILTGLLYPLFITAIAQLFFPWRANGSLILQDNKTIGSELIGQSFTDPKYFWARPSATTPFPYNAENSSGSNLGPSNPTLFANIKDRIAQLQQFDPQNKQLIPVDLVTSSASGLDPEISPQAAYYQLVRVAKTRGIHEIEIKRLIEQNIRNRILGILGEPRVNVVELNLALDNLTRSQHGPTSPQP